MFKRTFLFAAMALLMTACAESPDASEPQAEPPAAPLQLAGTRWVLVDPDLPAGQRAPTLEFGEAERAAGFSGCNQWFAQVTQANGGLTFGAVGMTRRACPEPAMTTEREFGAMLAATLFAQRDGEDLLFFGREAEQIARFTPQR